MSWISVVHLLALMLLSLGGAASALSQERAAQVLGPGDVLRITVYGSPDLTTEARVSESNQISFPLIGAVTVGGETPATAEARIAKALESGGFVKQPQVQVIVLQFRSQQVAVLGQVNRPGLYPIERPSTISDMLATAGGIHANGSDVVVFSRVRDGQLVRQEIDTVALLEGGRFDLNHPVMNGDIIYVPRMPVFYVYGEVQRPGAYRLERDMTLMQALSVGGSLTVRGSDRRIKLHRRDAAGQIQTLDAQLTDKLAPDDVIYVREALF